MVSKPECPLTKRELKRLLVRQHLYLVCKDPETASPRDWFFATASLVRNLLIDRWMQTARRNHESDAKRVYYLSMEFLLGRLLGDALRSLGMFDGYRAVLDDFGLDLDAILEYEPEPALGNGGLGRLAACLMESMASLDIAGYGYGLRYEFGMFRQCFEDGWQVEEPENWLRFGNAWEVPRADAAYVVRSGGRVVEFRDERGLLRHHWVDTGDVLAVAYDMPIAGHEAKTVNPLRLWAARSTDSEIDLHQFNRGDYLRAVEDKIRSETLSRILYPSDATDSGRELRFRQQYFFVSASIQDILRRFLKRGEPLNRLPDRVAVHLNETHPALAVAELMRLLVDEHGLDWDAAWDVTRRTFAYTNHTLMPEALETWPVAFFERLLPRHLQIVYEINHRFLCDVARTGGDDDVIRRMSMIDEENGRRVRMAHLAVVGSRRVNGVSAIHTGLLKSHTFRDFEAMFPERIVNVTNGISPRRWLDRANPALSRLISDAIGPGWMSHMEELGTLRKFVDDPGFRDAFANVKRANKEALAGYLRGTRGVAFGADWLFDVHIKRIHEYKRQLLNLLRVVVQMNRLRDGVAGDAPPRAVIFAGKAAPAYEIAKLIIKLIHDVAGVINRDEALADRLRVVFVPDYGVTLAERIIRAADLSEQISAAGTEASGTGNMKLALNGALTVATLDGANIELREAVGADNMFTFGLTVEDAEALRRDGYDPSEIVARDGEIARALDMIAGGYFSADEPDRFRPLVETLTRWGDRYFLLADLAPYLACQAAVDTVFRDRGAWNRRAILNVAGAGPMSSDRAIAEYARGIWDLTPVGDAPASPRHDPAPAI